MSTFSHVKGVHHRQQQQLIARGFEMLQQGQKEIIEQETGQRIALKRIASVLENALGRNGEESELVSSRSSQPPPPSLSVSPRASTPPP